MSISSGVVWYPEEIKQSKWVHRFLDVAALVGSWSHDPSTKVGAVIADPITHRLVSTGYNGFPSGVWDDKARYDDRETKLHMIIHAEENAILNARQSVEGMHIFIYPTIMIPACCHHCAAVIVQSGIKKVWMYNNDTPLPDRWKQSAGFAKTLLKEGGVEMGVVDRERSTVGGKVSTSYGL
jgi:dCMP deaminase